MTYESLVNPTFLQVCLKKKNQTAIQTPECNPKDEHKAFNSLLNETELNAQMTNIILQLNK